MPPYTSPAHKLQGKAFADPGVSQTPSSKILYLL